MAIYFFDYPDPFVWWQALVVLFFISFSAVCVGAFGVGGILAVPSLLFLSGTFVVKLIPPVLSVVLIASITIVSGVDTLRADDVWRKLWNLPWNFLRSLSAAPTPENGPSQNLELPNTLPTSNESDTIDNQQVTLSTAPSEELDSGTANVESPEPLAKATGLEGYTMSPLMTILFGFSVSFISAILGAGGPLILIPTLMWLQPKLSIKDILGSASAFSNGVVWPAMIGAFIFGDVDVGIGLVLLCTNLVCVAYGTRLALTASVKELKLGIGIVLILVGLGVITKAIVEKLG
eukprot:gene2091-2790_t